MNDNVSVENSGSSGVLVHDSIRNTMKNCNVPSKVSQIQKRVDQKCGVWSGHIAFAIGSGLMTIDGNATTIHHNGTNGYDYGLHAYSSDSIHLVSPLTKEMISTNNNGGRNYSGTIQTITNNNTKEEKK